ncbi:MAG: hypothetical protein ACO3EE_05990 [Flavobacteriales bacterium]
MEKKNNKSFVVAWIVVFAILFAHVFNPRTTEGAYKRELTFDTFSYYLYLPSTFIYDDIAMVKQDTLKAIFNKYQPSSTFYQIYQIENGNWVPNYNCGLAIVWSPFFAIAHTWASMSDAYPEDGFSFPYQFCIAMGSILLILVGIFFERKVLLKFFSDGVSAITMLFIVFGTNYFHEAFDDYLQPHALLFTGSAMLIYYTILWHESFQRKHAIYCGLLMGIMILIRPSEILLVFIPLLWNVFNKASLQSKIQHVKANLTHVLFMALAMFVVVLPQLIYYKIVTGDFIFFSYQRTEGFDFAHPHIWETLFSFKKSWFIYTPIIIFPLVGIFLMRKHKKENYYAIAVFSALNFYLLSSWACWWQGGCFGLRYFVQSYVLLSLPFALVIQLINNSRFWIKISLYLVLFALSALNLFQTWQYVNWIIPADRMNWEYYKRIWLKTEVTDEDRAYMQTDTEMSESDFLNNIQYYDRRTVAFFNYETINSSAIELNRLDTLAFSKPYSFKYGANEEWGPTFSIPYEHLVKPDKDHVWLRVSLDYYAADNILDNPACVVFNMPHGKYLLKYRTYDLEKLSYKPNQWNHAELYYMTPFPYLTSDKIEIYLWHRGKKDFYIDNLHIEAFDKK